MHSVLFPTTSSIRARSCARDQVDATLNLTGNPMFAPGLTAIGPARPQLMSHGTGFWAQGVDIGVSGTS